MRASAVEFRLRYLIHVIVFFMGFFVPWGQLLHIHNDRRLWAELALYPAQHGWMSILASTVTVTAIGVFFALAGAWMRVWGTAYLGSEIVKDGAMHGNAVIADGPYRFVRNPLYLGTWLFTLSLILFMEWPGAIFVLVAITIIQLRLIGGEEPFLTQRIGPAYTEYCARVPRIVPAVRACVPASGHVARWGNALLGEIYFAGSAVFFMVVFAIYGETFLTEHILLFGQGQLGAFGLSLIAKAFVARPASVARTADGAPQ